MKRHYSDCVRYFLTQYISTLDIGATPKFKNAAEKVNWLACHEVLSTLDPQDLKLVCDIYRRGDTVADNIYQISRSRRTSQGYYWRLVDDVEYKIAQKRGLI